MRDESAVWDDPDEATRKLSAHDLARTVDSATDLNMDWDEDESTTCTYNPSQMAEAVGLPTVPADLDTGPDSRQSIIQASPRARMKTDPQLNQVEPRPASRARTRSGTIPRAVPAAEAAQQQRPQSSQSGMRTRAARSSGIPGHRAELVSGEPGTRPYDFKRDDLAQEEELEWQQARAQADHEVQLRAYEEERAWHEAQVQAQQVAALEEQRAWLESQARAERAGNQRSRQEERARRETQARAAERAREEERAWREAQARAAAEERAWREARAQAEREAEEDRAWHEAQARAERAAAAEAARREQEHERARREAQARAERVAQERAREEERAWREAKARAEQAAAVEAAERSRQAEMAQREAQTRAAAEEREWRKAQAHAERVAAAERAQQQQEAQERVLREAQAHEERVAAAKAAERARAEEREWRAAMAQAQRAAAAPQPVAAAVPQFTYQPDVAEDSMIGELTPARTKPLHLALWSVLPGTGLLGAVLAARVLLAGPAPVPAPPAPPVVVEAPPAPAPSPASVAPIVEDVPAPQAAPTRKERSSRSSSSSDSTRSSRRSSASSDSSSSSEPAEPRERPSRQREVAASVEPVAEPAPSRRSQTAAASGIGLLRLNSRPWSQVFVDGKPMGNTPQMGLRLSAGSHQVELINREMGMSKKFQVKIEADEVVTRIETLTE